MSILLYVISYMVTMFLTCIWMLIIDICVIPKNHVLTKSEIKSLMSENFRYSLIWPLILCILVMLCIFNIGLYIFRKISKYLNVVLDKLSNLYIEKILKWCIMLQMIVHSIKYDKESDEK